MSSLPCGPRRLAVLLLMASPSSWAGQPLSTDDAAVLTAKSCQVETWARISRDERDYWLQPACNFTGNLELSIGGARLRPDDADASSGIQLQAKTVLIPQQVGRAWSFGATAGAARDTGAPHGSSGFQMYYAKALASWFARNNLEMDLNLGAANVYQTGTFALAGAAVQYAVIPSVQLLAEIYRDEPGTGKYQIAVRYIAIPNRFEAYVSYGNRFSDPGRQAWTIIGIRAQTPAFLP